LTTIKFCLDKASTIILSLKLKKIGRMDTKVGLKNPDFHPMS
jgi:hypothetical protein